MSTFNYFERAISRLLSKVPFFKKVAKVAYSRLVFLKHKKSYNHQTSFDLKSYQSESESFFGYYDKSPANRNGLVLCHFSKLETSGLPNAEHSVEVALFSPGLVKKIWSAYTSTYNWQQGSRLHWLDDELFIYNDFDSDNQCYVAMVLNAVTLKQIKKFDLPVQDSFGTDYFLSLNYRRLMSLRPDYGYRNLTNMSEAELKDLENDGIWRVDYKTGESVLLVSIAQICKVAYRPEFANALHKCNHIMISPDGSQFIFLHRYFSGQRRLDRLMLADAKTGEIKLLSDYGMVSHCFWANDKTILGYMRGPKNKDAYWLVDIDSGSFTHFSALDGLGDGHPHVHGDWFVADTYPDKSRMQHLNLVNWKTGEVKKLGEFFHGFEYSGEARCDLHPRFSPCGKKVYFDSVFSGKRSLYEMEIES
ncbi:glycosyl transferase [Galenea microaerophila]